MSSRPVFIVDLALASPELPPLFTALTNAYFAHLNGLFSTADLPRLAGLIHELAQAKPVRDLLRAAPAGADILLVGRAVEPEAQSSACVYVCPVCRHGRDLSFRLLLPTDSSAPSDGGRSSSNWARRLTSPSQRPKLRMPLLFSTDCAACSSRYRPNGVRLVRAGRELVVDPLDLRADLKRAAAAGSIGIPDIFIEDTNFKTETPFPDLVPVAEAADYQPGEL